MRWLHIASTAYARRRPVLYGRLVLFWRGDSRREAAQAMRRTRRAALPPHRSHRHRSACCSRAFTTSSATRATPRATICCWGSSCCWWPARLRGVADAGGPGPPPGRARLMGHGHLRLRHHRHFGLPAPDFLTGWRSTEIMDGGIRSPARRRRLAGPVCDRGRILGHRARPRAPAAQSDHQPYPAAHPGLRAVTPSCSRRRAASRPI